jgi:hypothetical protein
MITGNNNSSKPISIEEINELKSRIYELQLNVKRLQEVAYNSASEIATLKNINKKEKESSANTTTL